MNMSDERQWKIDRHVSIAVIIGFIAQTVFGAIWVGWWGSSYNSQLSILTATVAELRIEQRAMQGQVTTSTALNDKRLALLENAVPEIKQVNVEIRSDLRQLNQLLNDYMKRNVTKGVE